MMPPKESKPGNGLKGPDDKEVMTGAHNLQRDAHLSKNYHDSVSAWGLPPVPS